MKKRLGSLLIALMMVLALCVPAGAQREYGQVYDETELFDSDLMQEMGQVSLPEFSQEHGVDIRLDILTTIGEFSTVGEAAQYLFEEFGYGDSETGEAVTLTLYVSEDETGVQLLDWFVLMAGEELMDVVSPDDMVAALRPSLDPEAWSGDITEDGNALLNGMQVLAAQTEKAALGGKPAAPAEPVPTEAPAPTEAPLSTSDREEAFAPPEKRAEGVYVLDEANILTPEERKELEALASAVTEEYNCGVYLCTTQHYEEENVEMANEAMYEKYQLGTGPDRDCVILLLSMSNRKYDIMASGYGNTAFTDFGKDKLAEKFLDDFGEDNWYAGFADYIEESGDMLRLARKGKPLDINNNPAARGFGVLACVLIGFGIAFAVGGVLKRQLRSVAKMTQANVYAEQDGVVLTEDEDRFTRTTESRTYSPRKRDSSSGSSGGTTTNSSGHSHSSGSF